MVEQKGCIYCEAWHHEIMPQYPLTTEGKTAPLRRVEINGPWPDGIALARRPNITPTFILLQDGKEVGRLEGYVGENYFFPLLDKMIKEAGIALASAEPGG
ncbi:SoxS protein [Paracoccus suum]|uniref:SoxS protein n=2 Tax=Paracoccus suum TaxID=2259340 RepID=A0A344PP35_9RHOB|nr:SoxS protein [Paracoccus suum]